MDWDTIRILDRASRGDHKALGVIVEAIVDEDGDAADDDVELVEGLIGRGLPRCECSSCHIPGLTRLSAANAAAGDTMDWDTIRLLDRAAAGDRKALDEIVGSLETDEDGDADDDEVELIEGLIGRSLPRCECSSCDDCGRVATTTDDGGVAVCEGCRDWIDGGDGQVICPRQMDGGSSCHECGEEIEWGCIQTDASPGPNYRAGRCGCDGRRWRDEDRGGFGHLSFEDEDEEEEEADDLLQSVE